MDSCKGLIDWFNCLRCPYLCTKSCPIESEDAFGRFLSEMRGLERGVTEEGRKA